jgi:hypothetical protein
LRQNLPVRRYVKELLDLGKEQGYLTFDDINEILPDSVVSPEELESILMFLRKLDVDIIEASEEEKHREAIEQEERTDLAASGNGQTFRVDRPTYRQMLTQVTVQGQLYDDAIEDDTMPCMCHE